MLARGEKRKSVVKAGRQADRAVVIPFQTRGTRGGAELSCSADSEASVMTQLTRMPGQNDVLLRDARCHQFIGDGAVRPVVLNPDLIADEVDVDDRAVN